MESTSVVIGSAEGTVKLWEEKITQLTGQANALDDRLASLRAEEAGLRTTLQTLSTTIETKETELANLTNDVTNGQRKLEENKQAVLTALAEREHEASDKVEAAEHAVAQSTRLAATLAQHRDMLKGIVRDLRHEANDQLKSQTDQTSSVLERCDRLDALLVEPAAA